MKKNYQNTREATQSRLLPGMKQICKLLFGHQFLFLLIGLMSLASIQFVNAQTSCVGVEMGSTVNGVTVTGAGTGSFGPGGVMNPAYKDLCTGLSPSGKHISIFVGTSPRVFTYTYTFSQRVNNVVLYLDGVAADGEDIGIHGGKQPFFSTSDGLPTITGEQQCNTFISGNQIKNVNANGPVGSGSFRFSTPTGFTSLTVYGDQASLYGNTFSVRQMLCSVSVIPCAPTITTQPIAKTTCLNTATTFTAAATGTGLTYQWQQYAGGAWSNLAADGNHQPYFTLNGTKTASLTVTPGASNNVTQFRCVVTSSSGCSTTSSAAAFTVNNPAAPTITTQPTAKSYCPGGNATFSVVAGGTGPFTYQWEVSADNGATWYNEAASNAGPPVVSGGTSATVTYTNIQAAYGNRLYRVKVTSACGTSVTSSNAALTVGSPPAITTQPLNTTVCPGSDATFSVAATGTDLTYLWEINYGAGWVSAASAGYTTATLTSPARETSHSGYQYRVRVTSAGACEVISNVATVTVQNAVTTGAIAGDQTVCAGADPAAFTSTTAGTGSGTITYRWEQAVAPFTTWTTVSGATAATYDAAALTATTQFRRVTVSTQNSVECTATSPVVTVTVNAPGTGGCAVPIPDLTPTTDIDDLSFATGQSRDFAANIYEIVGNPTSGTVTFRVSRLTGWNITVPGITLSATDQSGVAGSVNVGGGTTHENEKWLFKQNSGFITATLKAGNTIPSNGSSSIGFTATRASGTPKGTTQNITVTIVNGAGGEVEVSNNMVITSITAN